MFRVDFGTRIFSRAGFRPAATKIQLIHYKEPTLDEKAFAQNHSFTFVNGEKKRLPRIYRLSYNGVMLKYLANKFGKEIYEELESLYNRNN